MEKNHFQAPTSSYTCGCSCRWCYSCWSQFTRLSSLPYLTNTSLCLTENWRFVDLFFYLKNYKNSNFLYFVKIILQTAIENLASSVEYPLKKLYVVYGKSKIEQSLKIKKKRKLKIWIKNN